MNFEKIPQKGAENEKKGVMEFLKSLAESRTGKALFLFTSSLAASSAIVAKAEEYKPVLTENGKARMADVLKERGNKILGLRNDAATKITEHKITSLEDGGVKYEFIVDGVKVEAIQPGQEEINRKRADEPFRTNDYPGTKPLEIKSDGQKNTPGSKRVSGPQRLN